MTTVVKTEKLHRYETKIPLQRVQYQELRVAFLSTGLHVVQPYPDRVVHSIYIDTPEFDDYHDNIAGINQRSKTRLRWYDDDARHLTLEIKRKRNKVSETISRKLINPVSRPPVKRSDFLTLMRTGTVTVDNPYLVSPSLSPTLEVQYLRSYFVIGHGIRMTIDRDMRFRKLYPIVSQHWIRSPVDAVLEFKYAIGQERDFSELVRNLPFRIFRHSKYVIGTDSTCVG